jgi:DNA-binding HxlR family transcriptional regulator
MTQQEVVNEIRLQTAILKAAHRPALEALASEVRADELSQAIVEALEPGTMSATALRNLVLKKVPGAADRTLSRRLGNLVERGVIRRLGNGPQASYELTGLL